VIKNYQKKTPLNIKRAVRRLGKIPIDIKPMYLILLQHNTPALLDHHVYMCVTIQAIRIVDEETSYEHKTFLTTKKRKSPIEYIHSRCHQRHLTSFFFNYTESIQAKLCLVKKRNRINIDIRRVCITTEK
jgi:hypothetical protein